MRAQHPTECEDGDKVKSGDLLSMHYTGSYRYHRASMSQAQQLPNRYARASSVTAVTSQHPDPRSADAERPLTMSL